MNLFVPSSHVLATAISCEKQRSEPPRPRESMPALYCWHDSRGRIVLVVQFAGAELIVDIWRRSNELEPGDAERAAAWLERFAPHLDHEGRYQFLWV